MSHFLLEHVLKGEFGEFWILSPTHLSCYWNNTLFFLEERTICSSKRTLKTCRTPSLLLIPVWFYQMDIWSWIPRASPCHFPPAPIPKRFPEGAQGCSPCTTHLQRTCCQVCVQLPSSFTFHCEHLLVVFVCLSGDEIVWREGQTSHPPAALHRGGLHWKATAAGLDWNKHCSRARFLVYCLVSFVFTEKNKKLASYKKLTNYSSLD